jgi:hypothetical protein
MHFKGGRTRRKDTAARKYPCSFAEAFADFLWLGHLQRADANDHLASERVHGH